MSWHSGAETKREGGRERMEWEGEEGREGGRGREGGKEEGREGEECTEIGRRGQSNVS